MVSRPAEIVEYELARRNNDTPGPLGLNLTSNPSLAFYVDDPDIQIIEVPKNGWDTAFEDLQTVLGVNSNKTLVVVTRPGRISDDEMLRLDAGRKHLNVDHVGTRYLVYKRYSLVMPPPPRGPF